MEKIVLVVISCLLGFVAAIIIIGLLWQFVDYCRYMIAVLRGKEPHTKFWDNLNVK